MSPEAAALAQRLHDEWDALGALVADAPPAPAEALELTHRTGLPLARMLSAPHSARRSAPAGSAAGRGNHTRVAS